jgi:hypothetical protein
MAFVTERSLFIHVQKTGGMSVREVLYRCAPVGHESGNAEGERHFGLPELRARHPGIESGRLSFGFVRHPVDWLVSRWSFAVQSGFPVHIMHRATAAQTWMAACWAPTFEGFIENYLERFPGVASQEMLRRLGFWSDKPVDRVGRCEHLMDDLTEILQEAGETWFRQAEPYRNKTTGVDKPVVSVGLRHDIMDAEKLLCDRFGYH